MPESIPVFCFEGLFEVSAAESAEAMAGWVEAIDVDRGTYAFFGADGSVISAEALGGRVVLALTGEKRPDELGERLRTYLYRRRMSLELVDDPTALAIILMQEQRDRLWPRRPRWVHRLIYR